MANHDYGNLTNDDSKSGTHRCWPINSRCVGCQTSHQAGGKREYLEAQRLMYHHERARNCLELRLRLIEVGAAFPHTKEASTQ